MNEPVRPSQLLRNLLITGLIIALMIFAQTLLIPIAWAFLCACLLLPLCTYLEKHKINRSIVAVLVTLLFLILSGVIFYYLIFQAISIIQNNDEVVHKIKAGLESGILNLQAKFGVGFYKPDTLKSTISSSFKDIIGVVSSQLSSVGANLLTLALTPVFLFFILNYRGLVKEFFDTNYSGEKLDTIQKFVVKAQTSVKNYLWGTLVLTVVTAIMTFIILMLFGIKSALFFSVFLAVLNIIPYVGNLIAYIGILSFVWVTTNSGSTVAYIGISLYFSNMIQENILRPKFVGDKMEINAFMVLSAVILGAIIWGVSGMVLFVPFLGIFKALIESNDSWSKYSVFFKSGDPVTDNSFKKMADKIFRNHPTKKV